MKFIELLNDQGVTYGSYRDFWRLVELSGFETVHQDSVWRDNDDVYCVPMNNGNAAAWAKSHRKCKLILWQFERWNGSPEDYAPAYYDEVWITDRWQAGELKRIGLKNIKYVPVGSHPGLGGEPAEKKYDLAPMCYAHGRREYEIRVLAQKYRMAPTCWPPERDKVLAATRAGLCLHQWDNDPAVEPLRAALFAAWKLPMVYAPCRDFFPYEVYSLNEIPAALVDERGTAKQNYDLLTGAMSFRNNIEAAL